MWFVVKNNFAWNKKKGCFVLHDNCSFSDIIQFYIKIIWTDKNLNSV